MKIAHLNNVTRVTVVGKNGLAYEDYNLFKDGAEIHLQDDDRTIKIFPASDLPVGPSHEKRTLVGRIGQMQLKNPWTWPVIALSVLLVVVTIGTIAALLAGCAPSGGYRSGTPEPNTVRTGSGSGITENTIVLTDGRTVTCLTWSSHNLMDDTTSSGMDCLEPKPE